MSDSQSHATSPDEPSPEDRSAAAGSSVLIRLLDRCREGDAAAREELFEKCRSYVQLIARSQLESWMRTKVDASDLVQQTLLEAHRGFQEFRGVSEAEWLAWLRQILAHNTQDFIRRYRQTAKRQTQREVSMNVASPDLSASFVWEPADTTSDSPSQVLFQHEREIELANAIAKLSTDHQEVIVLRNLQRLSFDEVAGRMQRTRPATQMLWMRAIKRLQQLMEMESDEQ